jgi:hypothetical protein
MAAAAPAEPMHRNVRDLSPVAPLVVLRAVQKTFANGTEALAGLERPRFRG